MAHGLAGHAPSAGFPANSVAQEYAWWCNKSGPFDIGQTTRQAFRLPFDQTTDYAGRLHANVQNDGSLGSKANGATMRATPLAIWAHRLGDAAIAAAAAQDAGLSHPSQECRDANAAYVLALASLVRSPGDAEAALAAAEGWAEAHACTEVQQWLAAARDDAALEGYDATHQIGFVKHAMLLTFYHLRRRSGFVEGLKHTLLAGGDTDTNAAIVCGMLGALHGVQGIPAAMRSQVETYQWRQPDSSAGQPRQPTCGADCVRPERLWGAQVAKLARQLYEDAVQEQEEAVAEQQRRVGSQQLLGCHR